MLDRQAYEWADLKEEIAMDEKLLRRKKLVVKDLEESMDENLLAFKQSTTDLQLETDGDSVAIWDLWQWTDEFEHPEEYGRK
jgi:hypothetical protein